MQSNPAMMLSLTADARVTLTGTKMSGRPYLRILNARFTWMTIGLDCTAPLLMEENQRHRKRRSLWASIVAITIKRAA